MTWGRKLFRLSRVSSSYISKIVVSPTPARTRSQTHRCPSNKQQGDAIASGAFFAIGAAFLADFTARKTVQTEAPRAEGSFQDAARLLEADSLQSFVNSLPVPPSNQGSEIDVPLTRYAVADAAAKASPAVVHITLSFDHRFFLGQSEGSGFIVSPRGIVLTNAHVVAEAYLNPHKPPQKTKVQVSLQDGRTFSGRVLCMDALSDIAVLQLEGVGPEPLPVARLGSSKTLRAGEWVIALGSPLTLADSVTLGVVSSTGRKSSELGLSGSRNEYIQTDASINTGHSGGPLVSLSGEIVGINCMKALSASGIGFAIPIDSALRVVRHLAQHGRVVRPFVGMKMLELNPGVLSQLREREPFFPRVTQGVLVPQVLPGSPAERAGLRAGDVIVGFGGHSVSSVRQIYDILDDKVGVSFEVEVRRQRDVSAVLTVVTEEVSLAQ